MQFRGRLHHRVLVLVHSGLHVAIPLDDSCWRYTVTVIYGIYCGYGNVAGRLMSKARDTIRTVLDACTIRVRR